jgi:N-methylhydantoinase A/oxoprolinase/acetone carboxylase beta subunit
LSYIVIYRCHGDRRARFRIGTGEREAGTHCAFALSIAEGWFMQGSFRVGIDIGGTFTDIVLLADDGKRHTRKVPSSVDDYARAIIEGLAALLAEIGAAPEMIAELLHGTTVASNAILEHKGAKDRADHDARVPHQPGRIVAKPFVRTHHIVPTCHRRQGPARRGN